MKDPDTIFLIGFSGSGKSTVGPALASRMQVAFIDTDDLIAGKEGKPVPEILASRGERYFRALESAIIEATIANHLEGKVVSLGGGAFQDDSTRRKLLASGLVVYLSCSVREIYRRLSNKDDRPMLWARPEKGETMSQARLRRIKVLLGERLANYALADITVSTTGKLPGEVVTELHDRIRGTRA